MVEEHNKKVGPEHRVVVDIPPEPYTGNPLTAKIVLLNLNPGYAPNDHVVLTDPTNLKRLVATLRHEPQDYQFYHLHPDLLGWTGHQWWTARFKPVVKALEEIGVDKPHLRLSENVAAIEWFPYHSKSFKACAVASVAQLYSWQLAQQAVTDPGRLVILMRARKSWESVLGKLALPALNPLNPYLSPAQLGSKLFERLIHHLSGETPVLASSPVVAPAVPLPAGGGLAGPSGVLESVRDILNGEHGWTGGKIEGNFLRYKGPGSGTTYSMGFVKGAKTLAELYIPKNKALLASLETQVPIDEINGTMLLWENLDGKKACRVCTRRKPAPSDATIMNFVADITAIRELIHILVEAYYGGTKQVTATTTASQGSPSP